MRQLHLENTFEKINLLVKVNRKASEGLLFHGQDECTSTEIYTSLLKSELAEEAL